MPRPTEAHQKLKSLAGKWSGTEKMHPSPWDPKGGEAQAMIDNRVGASGFILTQDYEQKRGDQVTFTGHGVFAYDKERQCYTLHWWDSMGMAPNQFVGDMEGDVLTLVDENPMGMSRGTFYLKDAPGKYEFKMEMSQDGESWNTLMEGSYTRAD